MSIFFFYQNAFKSSTRYASTWVGNDLPFLKYENIVAKGEIAQDDEILLLPQCFNSIK